jgi:simple sugar transport system ATP-binding protein
VLYRGAKIIILDEPTAVLVPQEVEELFTNLRELTAEGLTVIFISHKLDEVLSVADAITVIRRGTTVASVDPSTVTARDLATLMVGAELPSPEARESTVTDVPALTVDSLTVTTIDGRALVDGVSFTIHKGEVLGIAGVEGNGQAELVEAIMGMRPSTGAVSLGDGSIGDCRTRERREAGIGYIPEDRHRHGCCSTLRCGRTGCSATRPSRPTQGPAARHRRRPARHQRIVEQYDVRTPGIDVMAAALVRRQPAEAHRRPGDEPRAEGADRGASHPGRRRRRPGRHLGPHPPGAPDGLGVLLISADLDELIGLSDSLKVIYRGRMVAEADPATITAEQLGLAMTGAHITGGENA